MVITAKLFTIMNLSFLFNCPKNITSNMFYIILAYFFNIIFPHFPAIQKLEE